MEYMFKFTPFFEKQLKNLKKKDKVLFERLWKKLKELRQNQSSHFYLIKENIQLSDLIIRKRGCIP